ncbi:MAG: serine hydrolase [Bacteroidota bacterium]
MRFALTLFLGFTSLFVFGQAKDSIEYKINQILEATQVPGAAVGVIYHDAIYFTKGFGFRELSQKLPVDTQTIFPIGSCSKAFTASLLGLAQEKDLLDFKDAPSKHIPELQFANANMDENIQIRDLLAHSTGLPRHDLSWYLFPTQKRESLTKRIAHLEPFAKVREQYHYNNFGYFLAGELAEKAFQSSWDYALDSLLFKPLQMHRTHTDILQKEDLNTAMGYASLLDATAKPMTYYDLKAMAPAGSICSSLEDMLKWTRCWLNFGQKEGKTIIPIAYAQEAISSQTIMRANLPSDAEPYLFFSNYGYGWMLSSYKGKYRVEHGGNINGFSANVCFLPTEGLGIVVLTNQNNSDATYLIRNTLIDHILNLTPSDWLAEYVEETKIPSDVAAPQTKGEPTTRLLVDFVGTYHHPGYGTITILLEKNTLQAQFPVGTFDLDNTDKLTFQLQANTSSKIDPDTVPDLELQFILSPAENIEGLTMPLEPMLDPIHFQKIEPKS